MNIRNKLIVSGAAVLLVTVVIIETMPASRPSTTSPSSINSFATRFQPDPAVLAGIGSSGDLTPVPLNGPGSVSAPAVDAPTAAGGRHARDRQRR